MRLNRTRRGVSEVIGVLLMLAIVVSLGVLVFAFASGGLRGVSESYAAAMAGHKGAAAEKFMVVQGAFAFQGSLALDGTSTNQATGSSTSIATTLTTSSSDVVIAYVSPADLGSTSPPSVSGVSGGGLTWSHRATSPAQTYTTAEYLPITLTNCIGGGCSATTSPFQQMITWNPSSYSTYEATNLGNIRFCADSGCNNPLYAWLESCSSACSTSGSSSTSATAWVRLTSVIPANGGTLTIYAVFEPTSTNFDDNYWGEAPQLSPTYGQYDNGANVFNAYFDGNTAVSSFSVYTGYTLAQATGITGPGGATVNAIKGTGYNGGNAVFSFSTALTNNAMVVESSFSSPGSTTTAPYTGTDTGAAGLVDNAAAGSVANAISANMGYGAAYFDQDYETGGAFTADQNPAGTATANWVYATLTYTGPSAASWSAFIAPQLYSSTGGYAGTVANNPISGSSQVYLGQLSDTAAGYTLTVYYNFMRARAYPPNGNMPTTALGSPTGTTATFDVEEWYAVASSPLSSASITATLSASDTAATWIALMGISGANTISPFDPNAALPATASGANNVQTTVSTTDSTDFLLYACAAEVGGVASGFTGIASNIYSPYQNQFVGYDAVTSPQTNVAVSCGGAGTYGTEISDAVTASPPGAQLYVRNVGAVPVTLVSVYVTDLDSGSLVSQTSISTTVNVGTFAEIPSSSLSFTPTHGHAYSFTVTSLLGNGVVYTKEAT
jgi:flagellin-like protein